MLEHSSLRIMPEFPVGDSTATRWLISTQMPRESVGFAVSLTPHSGWRSWFTSLILEVREIEDEPLLMTVQRNCLRHSRWHVFDADHRRLGRLAGSRIFDQRERPFSSLCWSAATSEGHFETESGRIHATLQREGASWRLTFASDQAFHPFRRMLLLASSLCWILNSSPLPNPD